MKLFITTILLSTCTLCFSQDLQISNSKSSENILKTDYLEVTVKISNNENCCDHIDFEGKYTSQSKDSLVFDFSSSVIKRKLDVSKIESNPNYLNYSSTKTIAKEDIVFIKDYKSKKNKKKRENLSVIGGLIMIGGLATTLNALIFADNKKSTLLIAGGIQLGAGFTIGLGSNKKRKRFKTKHDPWKFN